MCLSAIDSKTLSVVDRDSLQQALDLQVQAVLRNIAQYNQVMNKADVRKSVGKAITDIFDVLYSQEFMANDNLSYQVKTITSKIHDAFAEAGVEINACIDKQRESNELDTMLKNL